MSRKKYEPRKPSQIEKNIMVSNLAKPRELPPHKREYLCHACGKPITSELDMVHYALDRSEDATWSELPMTILSLTHRGECDTVDYGYWRHFKDGIDHLLEEWEQSDNFSLLFIEGEC